MVTEVNDHASKPHSAEGGDSSTEKARRDIIVGCPPLRPRAKRSAVNTESYVRSNHDRSGIRQHSPWLESGLTSRLLTFSPFAGPRSDPSFLFRSPCDPVKKKKKAPREKKKGA